MVRFNGKGPTQQKTLLASRMAPGARHCGTEMEDASKLAFDLPQPPGCAFPMIVAGIVSPPSITVPVRLPSARVYGSPVRQNILPENCHPSVIHFSPPVLWNVGLMTKSALTR